MFEFKNKTILIISPEDWGDNLLSKHLYALELSKRNNLVYFLHASPHPNQNNFVETSKINENLTLIRLKHVVKGIFKLPSFLIDIQNKTIINKIKRNIPQPIDVIWSFDQSKFQNLKQFKAKYTIFHPVDYIIKAKPFISRIANSADVVFSVSELILNQINTITPKHFINHGVDEIFFNKIEKINTPNFIKPNNINVGYIGNLTMKFIDWKYLFKTVKDNPQLHFVFIGPYQKSNLGNAENNEKIEELMKFENTAFTGSYSKTKLIEVLPFFDIFWLCYNHVKYPIEVSNSHKILEYLSTGKVVVSGYIETYKNSNLLYFSNNNDNLATTIQRVCNKIENFNSLEKMQERKDFSKENTYKKQIERIEKIIATKCLKSA